MKRSLRRVMKCCCLWLGTTSRTGIRIPRQNMGSACKRVTVHREAHNEHTRGRLLHSLGFAT
jgi:hypothetical protein